MMDFEYNNDSISRDASMQMDNFARTSCHREILIVAKCLCVLCPAMLAFGMLHLAVLIVLPI